MTIKYSIVIPTRNRAEYLKYSIESVLSSTRNDIELIVSNNHSSDLTANILSKISDPRLKIVSPSVVLPMAGHYEFALNHASGNWITILGDDDALMPYFFESLDEYIKKYPGIDIVSSERAYYFWEGCEDLYGDSVLNYYSIKSSKLRSTKKDLMSVLQGLRSCYDMPQIYTTCIIKRSLFEEIKLKSGGYIYHSIIPDMYSIVALCFSREKYLRVDEPLFWVGTSEKSMGRSDRIYKDADGFQGNLDKEYANVPKKISEDISYILHSNGFSPLYIYECVLQCPLTDDFYKKNEIKKIVLSAIFNLIKTRTKSEKLLLEKEIYKECKKNSISQINLYLCSFNLKLKKLFFYFISLPGRFLKKFKNSNKLQSNQRHNFQTILDASIAINKLISKNKYI